MNDLKLICETIGYNKYEWNEKFESYFENGFDEVGECDLIFNNEFMDCLVEYLDKQDKPVLGPCGDKLQDIKVTIPYNNPIKFILNILI